MEVKIGSTNGSTRTVFCAVCGQPVATVMLVGAKVYVVVTWLLNAGDQVPEYPLVEITGKTKLAPTQMESKIVKVSEVRGTIVTVLLAESGHLNPKFVLTIPKEFGVNT